MKRTGPALALVSALVLLAQAAPLGATSFVMVKDEDLVDQAPLVVQGRVLSAEFGPNERRPATDYLLEVERVLKGALPGGHLIVRVPGGLRPDGGGLKIWGAPEFRPAERVVLFLRPGEDGTFAVLHLMLGAFREVVAGGRPVLVRALAEAREVSLPVEEPGSRARYRQPRDRVRFVEWIAARVAGARPEPDYFVAPSAVPPLDLYSFFTNNRGEKLRWRKFDAGEDVNWQHLAGGQPGLTPEETATAVAVATRAWTNDAATDIRYRGGNSPTGAFGGGLLEQDGRNAIVFDSQNPLLGGPFDCAQGGVLAIGGPWLIPGDRQPRNGEIFHSIGEGDVETNRNIECFFASSPNRQKAAEELFAHEFGHTLGLDHSCDDPQFPCDRQALMYDFIHDDGRGAQLRADDRAAIAYLYGTGAPPPPPGPAAPSALQATAESDTEVRLAWQDNSTDETGFRLERRPDGGAFAQIAQLGAGTTGYLDTGLTPGAAYGYRVRATNAAGNSNFSNVAAVTLPAVPPPPAPPRDLVARPISTGEVELTWVHDAGDETGFVVERSSPLGPFQEVLLPAAGATQATVAGLAADRPYTFRVRARGVGGDSDPSNEASATPFAAASGPCAADGETLCLLGGRFQARVRWRNQHDGGSHGAGGAEAFAGSDRTGRFWFFNPANVELIVKALDGRPVNGAFWLFYGALSDVEYWITVRDTATGESRTYHNPPGELCGLPDTAAFPAASQAAVGSPAALAREEPIATPVARAGDCQPGPETLCLLDGRFAVEVDWLDQRTLATGVGTPVAGSDRTGYFWFFNQTNLELVTKALDATSIDGRFWFFYGALSDVEYTITVRDTVTGVVKTYVNDPGEFCGQADTEGFPATLP